ncbi:hypothetical protein Hypma_001986 [Hypsizygus marmoreus]|uniref:Cytochrome P450 n=1 Tax=Hypsizygus marmoreus TaxID=39966 RepID=A0A369J5C3_HYPMA|nr:hypothetical protein Hypma_001986 [Hypsizygus marmoreus]
MSLISNLTDFFSSMPVPPHYQDILTNVSQQPYASWRALAVSVILGIAFTAWRGSTSSKGKLPPGPRGLPLLGSVLDLRNNSPWLTFTAWNKEYGPLVHVSIAGHNAVILGTHKVAADLLDRRSGIYSDRPRNIVVHELMNGKLAFASGSADEFWKKMRKASHEVLKTDVAKTYSPLQETESLILLSQLISSPSKYPYHVQRASGSLMRTVLYGLPPFSDSSDPVLTYLDSYIERLVSGIAPGAYWVEYFTWMEHLPRWMAKWRRDAEDSFKRDDKFFKEVFAECRERLIKGDDTPSVAAKLIQEQSSSGLSDQEAAWLLATLYLAGTEASAGQILWFMLALCLYPDIQKRAFEEVDRVVGPDRLPTLQDYDNLPYIQACVKETMRWRPLAPAGIPHRLREDDVYEGYFIPKDTICIPNTWALNHDPAMYGLDAEEFRPERHLNTDGQLLPSVPDTKEEGHVTYGFGQRICVGRAVSNRSLFVEMASMVWCFQFTMGKDDQGKTFVPDILSNGAPGVAYRPKWFPCVMTPRSTDTQRIVEQTKALHGVA